MVASLAGSDAPPLANRRNNNNALVKLEVNGLSSVKAVNDKQTITDDFDAFHHPMCCCITYTIITILCARTLRISIHLHTRLVKHITQREMYASKLFWKCFYLCCLLAGVLLKQKHKTTTIPSTYSAHIFYNLPYLPWQIIRSKWMNEQHFSSICENLKNNIVMWNVMGDFHLVRNVTCSTCYFADVKSCVGRLSVVWWFTDAHTHELTVKSEAEWF